MIRPATLCDPRDLHVGSEGDLASRVGHGRARALHRMHDGHVELVLVHLVGVGTRES